MNISNALNRIRSNARLYRSLMLVVEGVPGLRPVIRDWVEHVTAPEPDRHAVPIIDYLLQRQSSTVYADQAGSPVQRYGTRTGYATPSAHSGGPRPNDCIVPGPGTSHSDIPVAEPFKTRVAIIVGDRQRFMSSFARSTLDMLYHHLEDGGLAPVVLTPGEFSASPPSGARCVYWLGYPEEAREALLLLARYRGPVFLSPDVPASGQAMVDYYLSLWPVPTGNHLLTEADLPDPESAVFLTSGYGGLSQYHQSHRLRPVPAALSDQQWPVLDTRPLLHALCGTLEPATVATMPPAEGLHQALGSPRVNTSVSYQPPRIKTLYVDVSDMARYDIGTGIQRVVRNLVPELIRQMAGRWYIQPWKVEPVYEYQGEYYLARGFTHHQLGLTSADVTRRWRPDRKVHPVRGDMFLGLDWAQPMVVRASNTLAHWRDTGVHLHFVVYDLLPLQLPRYFPRGFPAEMEKWLHTLAGVADHIHCISETVAGEVRAWMSANGARPGLNVSAFPLGSEMGGSVDRLHPLSPGSGQPLAQDLPIVLMVGTLDPRKGHHQALSACERLWRQGHRFRLVVVGREGANNRRLVARLRRYQRKAKGGDQPLAVWLNQASDAHLEWLYHNAGVLLAASEGEGYGLPLIEGCRSGLPVIARDLPVFREVLHGVPGIRFFHGTGPGALSRELEKWLQEDRREGRSGEAFSSRQQACHEQSLRSLGEQKSWQSSATILLRCMGFGDPPEQGAPPLARP